MSFIRPVIIFKKKKKKKHDPKLFRDFAHERQIIYPFFSFILIIIISLRNFVVF